VRSTIRAAADLVVRGGAVFLGLFVLVGLVGELRGRETEIALWFVDIRDLHALLQVVLLGALGVALTGWGFFRAGGRFAMATAAVTIVFAALAVRDVVRFASAVSGGQVRPAIAIPLSAVIAVLLAILALSAWDARRAARTVSARRRRLMALAAAAFWAIAFPVAQIAWFGTTDYRRPADGAVVFGARVYATGEPSPLLADRIAAAVELDRSGLVDLVVMSGGDGSDGYNEAVVMADRAADAGVPADHLIVDRSGVSTDATVRNAVAILGDRFGRSGFDRLRIIAVSQAYHLPRIQLAFAGWGIDVLTVPAVDPIPISEMPLLVAREIPAFWTYYLRACLG
jgi:vancomycin permeability regulator SanA